MPKPTLSERMAVVEDRWGTVIQPMANQISEIHKTLHNNGLIAKVSKHDDVYEEHCAILGKIEKKLEERTNGQSGKKIMGKDTGDIWKGLIRLATIVAYIVASLLGLKVAFGG